MPAGRKGLSAEWLTEDGLILLEGWAREGLTDKQIQEKIGISYTTFYEWKKKYPEFADALKRGKAPVDFKVENQLLKSALGYYVTVKEPIKVRTKKQLKDKGTIEEEHIEYVDKQIYIPPVPICQFFWLKNRKPEKWRDKPITDTDVREIEDLRPLAEMIDPTKGEKSKT